MSDNSLTIAVPSKGRLQENCNAFFKRAGLPVERPGGERDYRGQLGGIAGVDVAFLSASEIARNVIDGSVHFGVTGADLIHETVDQPETRVELLLPLGFGHADVVVAVPKGWIDVKTMADLADVAADFRARHRRWIRVATKYINLTRMFFARHGIADYRIVESLGATEGAPAAGSAELIVDITSSGSTLAANNLKVLDDGVILKSQAHLVASLGADWSAGPLARARAMLDRIAAEAKAREIREVRALVADPEAAAAAAREQIGATTPHGLPAGWPLTLHVAGRKVADCAALLRGFGAETVTVGTLDYVFEAENALAARLESRLGR
ncbi:MAG: ATP phosphoribosyltransferase [Hyphomicrobiaceae bacterium]|nr:ATP phosphoribosyltransferase [Hyphomicrobiaceae bacterium]